MFFTLSFFNKSFPKRRIIILVGVTTKKKTIPIIIGDTIAPKKIPNLIHSLFNGVKNLEFKTPKIRKIIDKVKDQSLKSSPDFKGHNATIKNTTKNSNPKLRFDEIVIFEFDVIINYIYKKLYLVN